MHKLVSCYFLFLFLEFNSFLRDYISKAETLAVVKVCIIH